MKIVYPGLSKVRFFQKKFKYEKIDTKNIYLMFTSSYSVSWASSIRAGRLTCSYSYLDTRQTD